jgi:putative membrane protein
VSTTRRARERILREAEIAPNATKYHLVQGTVGLAVTIVGIPLLLVALPIAQWYYTRYYENLRVILTNRDLKVHRGIMVKEEKTIPLEKITDLRVYEGPIMRHMGLKGLAVETAGQTSPAGALVNIVGILDVDGFRDDVLDQRDRISEPGDDLTPIGPSPDRNAGVPVEARTARAGAGTAAGMAAGTALGESTGSQAGGLPGPGAGSTAPRPAGAPAYVHPATEAAMLEALTDIRDILRRMEGNLARPIEGE